MSRSLPYSTYFLWSFLGGFVGAILMVLVMLVAGMSLGMPKALLLRALGAGILGINPASFMGTMIGGLTIHLIDGTFIISSILVAIMLVIRRGILIKNVQRGALIGLLAGFLVFLIFGLPMLYLVMAPAAVKVVAVAKSAQTGMALSAVMPQVKAMLMMKIGYVAVAFFFAHLIYGVSWGTLTGLGASRVAKGFRCDKCGATFGSQDELMDHARKAHPMPAH